ncbi:hypothetical protein K474DRAFT_1708449 [Panus rudis PR-1116 ss-1]|nr:hypothetical protein K474DRAFT_1708449 [Panus rudis PR-1116 ss-1]
MEFLWVRNYRQDIGYKSGFHYRRLHRIGFIPESDPEAFGFVDPDDVIRAVHLIPAFALGRTDTLLKGNSVARVGGKDWKYFYVNFFVDRDMYMRYRGGGIGHYEAELQDPQPSPDELDDDASDSDSSSGSSDNNSETSSSSSDSSLESSTSSGSSASTDSDEDSHLEKLILIIQYHSIHICIIDIK